MNVCAYRLVRGQNIVVPRSSCPACHQTIAWYDLIPVISWLQLRGCCRLCGAGISWLYPAIELLTALLFSALFIAIPITYFFAYALFFSALIVTIRSDLETMLISRYVTLFLIPIAFVCSWLNALPIDSATSISGALFGYLFLYVLSNIFYWITKKEGMGEGDRELLAFIGAFTGICGAWVSLMIGSIAGSIVGIVYLYATGQGKNTRIPFGPFLAGGAIVYVLCQESIVNYFCTGF